MSGNSKSAAATALAPASKPSPGGVSDPAFFVGLSRSIANGFSSSADTTTILLFSDGTVNRSIALKPDGSIAYTNADSPAQVAQPADLGLLVHILNGVADGKHADSSDDPRFKRGIMGNAAIILKYVKAAEKGAPKPVTAADIKKLASFNFD